MSETVKVQANMVPLTLTNVMRIKVPLDVIKKVNQHIDKIQEKISYDHQLAGEIQKGEQTVLDFDHSDLADLKDIFLIFAQKYFDIYCETPVASRTDLATKDIDIELHDMWYNIYYEGDYNPLHAHGTTARVGLSSFLFLKTPEYLLNNSSKRIQEGLDTGVGGGGKNDGLTYFAYGRHCDDDVFNFINQSNFTVDPIVGDLYIFPKWLEHGVYPFRGPDERRTLAANINVWIR
jgi:hypothetical protein